jgi:peptide/nickel transport system substrate-binding protein
MKRFFSLAVFLTLGFSLVFAGGRGQQGGSGDGGNRTVITTDTVDDTALVQGTVIHDTTADIDVSKLTLTSAPGLPGNVRDRLPKIPKLQNEMPPDLLNYQTGKYGGTLRFVTSAVDWDADVFMMCNEAILNSPGIQGKEVTGNIVRGYTVSDDQKVFTFYLREGLKWSDGVPVTMEDFRFAIEDVVFNKKINPVLDVKFCSGGLREGTPMKFEVLDNLTFRLSFDQPYGGFLIRIAMSSWVGYTDILKPAHFLKKFHDDYATAAEKAKWPDYYREYGIVAGSENAWINLFNKVDITNWEMNRKESIGFPKLYPWILTSANNTVYTYERNPYYHKIDSTGQQLPYIDKLESYYVENMEMVQLKMLTGDIDFMRESASLFNIALYKENEAKGGYNVYLTTMGVTPTDISINMTYGNDEEYKSIVRNLKFRQALNKAIDREELIDALYYGYGEPSRFADPTLDLAGAEKLLQEIGMRKGSDGYYRMPSGRPFEIVIEHAQEAPDIGPAAELYAEMWKAIGINTTAKRIESSLLGNKSSANELQARVIWTATPLWYYLDWGLNHWGKSWEIWKNNTRTITITNADGTTTEQAAASEEPPQGVKDFYALMDKLMIVPLAEANDVYLQMQRHIYDNLWFFIPIQNVKQPVLVNKNVRNVAETALSHAVNYSGVIFWFDK